MNGASMPPRVSVLLPVYNAEATLAQCLQSIFQQTLQDFEIVAVDDFSTDASLAVLRQCRDPRLRIVQGREKGIVAALNTGLQHCRAPLVARMDADDVMYPQRLARQYRHLRDNPALTLSATQARKFPVDLIGAGYRAYMRWQNACLSYEDICRQIYIESPFAHPTVMFRRQRILELGAYRDGDFPEDYELWLRLFAAGERMEKLAEVLLDWRESAQRLSRVSPRYSLEAFEKLRARYLARDSRLRNRPVVFWGVGRKTRRRAQFLIDQGIRPSAWIDIDEKKIGNTYQQAVTHHPDWLCRQAANEVRPLVLNYVRNHGARDYCRRFLEQAGYRMGEDYLDVA